MKDWIKKRFEQTPARRISNAYWLGTFQTLLIYGFFQDLKGKEGYIAFIQASWVEIHWGWWVAAWVAGLVLFIKNNIAFERDTLWMTIKNPAKINIESDSIPGVIWGNKSHTGNTRPIKPPPPPAPPAPRNVGP